MAGGGIIDFLGGQVEWLGFSEYRNIVGEGGIKGEFWVNLLMAVLRMIVRRDRRDCVVLRIEKSVQFSFFFYIINYISFHLS